MGAVYIMRWDLYSGIYGVQEVGMAMLKCTQASAAEIHDC